MHEPQCYKLEQNLFFCVSKLAWLEKFHWFNVYASFMLRNHWSTFFIRTYLIPLAIKCYNTHKSIVSLKVWFIIASKHHLLWKICMYHLNEINQHSFHTSNSLKLTSNISWLYRSLGTFYSPINSSPRDPHNLGKGEVWGLKSWFEIFVVE